MDVNTSPLQILYHPSAPNQQILEAAVLEAGFATEPLRHVIVELQRCFYMRLLAPEVNAGVLSRGEREVLNQARELTGVGGELYGPE